MKFSKTLLAAAALVASFGANAQVAGSVGGGYGTFLTLSSTGSNTGLLGGTYGITGGTVYGSDQTFASIPEGTTIFGGNFLAAGPTAGSPATINFGTGIDYISFLWGSPDPEQRDHCQRHLLGQTGTHAARLPWPPATTARRSGPDHRDRTDSS